MKRSLKLIQTDQNSILLAMNDQIEDIEETIELIQDLAKGSFQTTFGTIHNSVLLINFNLFVEEERKRVEDWFEIKNDLLERFIVIDIWLPNLYSKQKKIGIENLEKKEQNILVLLYLMISDQISSKLVISINEILGEYIETYLE